MTMSIHDFLKRKRIEEKLSIQALSRASGVSASHISRIERFDRNPSPQTLEKLAPHLNVSYLKLLEIANLIEKSESNVVHIETILNSPYLLFNGEKVADDIKDEIHKILDQIKKD